MHATWTAVKRSLEDAGSLVADVFTTGKREGFRRTSVLLLVCSSCSLLLASLLLVYLLYVLDYGPAVAGGVAGCSGTLLTVALFLSKRARCAAALFVISVFMKKSRGLLLTAGTSLVVFHNTRNTLGNLAGLARSMVCNLRAKKAALAAPFSNYVKMLKWLGSILREVTDLGVVKLDHKLKISPKLELEDLQGRLVDVEQKLNETVHYYQELVRTASSVSDRVLPAVSLLVLAAFIALHVKRYRGDVRYQNGFISGRFVRFDEGRKAAGKQHVLPLEPREAKRYPSVPSARPTAREGKALLKFGAPVLSHLAAWVMFITVDALLYCFVVAITTKLSEMEPFRVPLLISSKRIATLIGIHLSEEIHQEDFSFSVTLFEKQCLPQPKLLLYESVAPLAAILLALLVMALLAAKASQLRLMVCERFFAAAADQRVEHLHAKILRRRSKKAEEESDGGSGFASLIAQPRFWCPLLFRAKEGQQSIA